MLCSVAPSAIMNLLFLLPLVSPRSCARDPIAVTDDGLVHRRHHWCRGAPRGPVRRLGGRPRAAPVYSQSTCPMLQSFEHMHEHASDEHEFEFESSVVSAGCSGSAVLSRNRRGRIGRGAEVVEKTRIRRSRRREEERRSAGNSGGGVLRNRSANEKKGGETYSTNTWCRPQVLSVPRTEVIVSTGAKSSKSTCRLPHLDVGRRRIADLIARVSLTHSRITAPCRALSGATACAERVALPGAWRARPRRRF